MSDPFDDPKLKEYFRRAKNEMFPKMKESVLSLTILGKPDPKLCLELGAAILFDKPIIVLVPEDMPIPANLKRCAATIIQGSPDDPETRDRLMEAVRSVTENDQRSRKS